MSFLSGITTAPLIVSTYQSTNISSDQVFASHEALCARNFTYKDIQTGRLFLCCSSMVRLNNKFVELGTSSTVFESDGLDVKVQ